MNEEKPGGKYAAMIQKARNQENQITSFLDNQITSLPDSQERVSGEQKAEEVNLSIKVPKRLRRHWVAEAKRRDTSLTAIIIASLKEKLGEP